MHFQILWTIDINLITWNIDDLPQGKTQEIHEILYYAMVGIENENDSVITNSNIAYTITGRHTLEEEDFAILS